MRVPALSVAAAVMAATIAGAAAPAAAASGASAAPAVELEAGSGPDHYNHAWVTYKRFDGAVNSVKILTVAANAGQKDCVWVEWNDPQAEDGWTALNTEPPCWGGGLEEHPDVIIKAPKDYQLKVRLAAGHGDAGVDHKDVKKLL